MFLLWKGLAAFVEMKGKRYLWGCCSMTSQNAAEGWLAARLLERENHFHTTFTVALRKEYVCAAEDGFDAEDVEKYELPRLFSTYLRFGAKVCSPPAIDRQFKTIDFFVIFDIRQIGEKYRQMFFG